MRRITTAITAAALSISIALSLNAGTAQALTAGYDSAYQFESAFLSLKASDSGTFSVFFANTGSTSWVAGSSSQVNLGICAADKVTCNVTSAQASWGVNWLSSTAYATHTKSVVTPGDFSAFTYNVKVPAGTAAGTYRFNGDLVRSATGDRIHPEGYFQDGTVSGGAPPPGGGGALSVTPAYSANEDNEVSTTVPGIGQHTYTFTTTLTGTLSFAVMQTSSGIVSRVSDGSYGFCDTNQDSKADHLSDEQAFITAVNGTAITATNPLINQAIPSNGTITITIDSAIRNERVRVVAWQDLNNNGQIDLTAAGDVNCDFSNQALNNTSVDGAMIVSGRKFWFGPQAQFGAQNGGTSCASNAFPIYRHDSANQVFGAGPKSGDTGTAGSVSNQGSNSLRYFYDANDIFQIRGTQVTLATFKSELTTSTSGKNDWLAIAYDPNPAGISTFNLCVNRGQDAPTDVAAAVGNFDNGSAAEDVRLTFTPPSQNAVLTFSIQRANKDTNGAALVAVTGPCTAGTSPNPNGSGTAPPSDGTAGNPPNANFSTIGSVTANGAGEQQTFTNFDLSNGTYCYRVLVTDPNTGVNSYSNYVLVTVSGTTGETFGPTSDRAELTASGGFQNTVDQGDKFVILFRDTTNGTTCTTVCGMSISSTSTIRLTDSDCGTATNAGPATCSGGLTNTVADIVCNTNATCILSTDVQTNDTLTITMTGNPTIVAAGSTAGAQYPVVITDSSGITDLSGNAWNLAGSADRVMGPNLGQ